MPRTLTPLLLAALALLLATAPRANSAQPSRTFLPMVAVAASGGPLGVEISWSTPDAGLAAISPGWVRRNGLSWSDVEPKPGGGYRWDAPAVLRLEDQLRAARRLGLRTILVIHGSPTWAVEPYLANCAPISTGAHDDFARFVQAAVRRYSAPPYGVKDWEIGNEPDAFIFAADAPFGCWGRQDEPLYGGQAYGELLKVVYPAIKSADPEARVLNGGLLLDHPYDQATGAGRSARFIEGVLATGAGNAFDILAFHSYAYYDGTSDGGLATDWKPAYLRAILARYDLNKPLLNTEGALLCPEPGPACTEAQAHAMGRIATRALRDNLLGVVWYLYDSDGFRATALVEPLDPARRRPAHRAFAQASTALAGQTYVGSPGPLPAGVEGHLLRGDGRSTIVIWANRPTAAELRLSPGAQPACAEWDGASFPCSVDAAGMLRIEARPGPRYVSWRGP